MQPQRSAEGKLQTVLEQALCNKTSVSHPTNCPACSRDTQVSLSSRGKLSTALLTTNHKCLTTVSAQLIQDVINKTDRMSATGRADDLTKNRN